MTETAQQLISAFKALPIAEQTEILLDLLRVPLETPYPAATDDELRTAADSLFLELDRRESQPFLAPTLQRGSKQRRSSVAS